ncbi:MAG: aldo/keto reductase [Desulfovibrio sp.]|nr:aldo/keto reductase [Desulfovibrio sp.]
MAEKKTDAGMSRRNFLRTLGVGGVAAGLAPVLATAALGADVPAAKGGAMPQRTLGKTGVKVSALCLGGMFDTINNQLLLKQALSWGVTYWDTAEVYGNGLSEEGFGRFLARNPERRKDIFLVTKLTPKAGNFTERLEKSLARLQTNHVDLFFIHSLTNIAEMTPEIMAWAAQMKKAGKFKYFGFSTHTNMEDCLLGAAKLGGPAAGLDVIMHSYNIHLMLKPKMKEAVAACVQSGIGLVAMKTQGGGPAGSTSEAELRMAERFLQRGFTDKQAKLKGVWEDPNMASICSQMPSLTILAANVAAAKDQTALDKAELTSLREYASACQGYCAGCGSICQQAVGGAVAVNEVMRALMYHKDYNEQELARQTFASLPDAARLSLTSIDYSKAEAACPQRLAIAELMREAGELLA